MRASIDLQGSAYMYIWCMGEPVIESMAEVRSHLAEQAEEEWLNRSADEAEAEGPEGSVSIEEMAAMLRDHRA